MKTFIVDGIILATNTVSFGIDGVIALPNYGPPGGRVEESDWLGHGNGGLFRKQDQPKGMYSQISPIHDPDEVPRLVNKELEKLDMFEQ